MNSYVINKLAKKYQDRRKRNPLVDMEFLTITQRKARICHKASDVDRWLQRHLKVADKKHEKGERHVVVLDVEEAQNLSWHERELKLDGVSEEELRERRRTAQSLKGETDRKKAASKVAYFWEHRKQDREKAICKSSVAAFAIAVAGDDDGELTFGVHCGNVIGQGRPQMPPTFCEFLQHPAVVFVNVGQREDLEGVINSFIKKRIEKVKYVDGEDFFLDAWGQHWNGMDDNGQWKSCNGVLNIVEHAFPGKTFYKCP